MYYHYTSTAGAKAIKDVGYIKVSGTSGAFGSGVYLTDLEPDSFFRDEILKNNYGGIFKLFKNRADWVVQVPGTSIDLSKLILVPVPGESRRRIWVYPGQITVKDWQVIDKPRCKHAPKKN